MSTFPTNQTHVDGLSSGEVSILRERFGKNALRSSSADHHWRIVTDIVREPMFILLAVACSLYFILGKSWEGIMMIIAMALVAVISVYQELKSFHALEALKQFTAPKVTVIRNRLLQVIDREELVPGDIMSLSEGDRVPADAVLLQSNDFSVNESLLTGEAYPVEKNPGEGQNQIYQGTIIESGNCLARVTVTGNQTMLGKIGRSIEGSDRQKTILQRQLNRLVRGLAVLGLAAFCLIFIVNYLRSEHITSSLLFALTLAMSAIPEELPVAFSSFMALGAYKMSQKGIISRRPQIIENLGAVQVLCLDKTGTITENNMRVKLIYDFKNRLTEEPTSTSILNKNRIMHYALLASEIHPFDSMEKAISEAFMRNLAKEDLVSRTIVHEYPLEGHPPMMTHIYRENDQWVIATKGAPERVLRACKLDPESEGMLMRQVKSFGHKGYRVLAVASATHLDDNFPESQDDFAWELEGLIAFYDPPKENVNSVIEALHKAGINIKMITGDYGETAANIAEQVGIPGTGSYVTGKEIMAMDQLQLQQTVLETNLFARMFPDAKLRVIEALKLANKVTAMTGDGINDAPAIKAADIGISMGRKGTETARQVADLIITDDNLDKIVIAIREGRKIYSNLVKALRYIISIHIPIILTAAVPVILNWHYPNIFSPIHIIFLELIMGPTCSIFFEREPVEANQMISAPRASRTSLFGKRDVLLNVLMGLVMTVGVLGIYYGYMKSGYRIEETRTLVFTTLIMSNIFLTFSLRSYTKSIIQTIRYKNNLAPIVGGLSILFLLLLHLVPGVRQIFGMASVSMADLLTCLSVAIGSIAWFEMYKLLLEFSAHSRKQRNTGITHVA